MKPLLVGEFNPYGPDPALALYPLPEGSSGDRLCRLVMGLRPDKYLEMFDRVNLCSGTWSVREARDLVDRIRARPRELFVLLGARVCAAFSVPFDPFTVREWRVEEGVNLTSGGPAISWRQRAVILPHPSWQNIAWNEPGAYVRAMDILSEAGVFLRAR